MTSTATAAQPRPATRLTRLLWGIAAALWLTGLVCGGIGAGTTGLVLRVAALVLCAAGSLRRSSLLFWTLFCMMAGIELGVDSPHAAAQTHFLADLFLRLIRMIVAPLLFTTITTGIAGHGQLRSVGRVAIKALIYFEIVTTLGMILGAIAIYLSGAGWGVSLPASAAVVPATQSPETWQQIVLNLFPENIAQAVAQNQVLQVAIFSVFFGSALAMLPDGKRAPLVAILQSLADTMFKLTNIVMVLAPIAAGAALAYTVGGVGLRAMLPLAKLGITYYAALVVFTLLVQIPSLVLFRIPLRPFIAAIGEPASIGFATTTSEAALPLAMERMEEFGVPRWIVSFVIPTGYSFNMTGSSVYLSMASIFCAQAAGIHLSAGQLIAMLAILMLASKGVAGVPRAVLVVLLATASAVHLPTAPILLILGIDTLMDMGRTLMNVVGNCIASAIIARSEGVALVG
ncbi:MAG TPA: cation:dicarboxylase symporter family transporter [Terracidiphilus sp.]|nr:cation:dicarboxylase symporter family transporter [Terracidiphilus sp.]